MKVFQIGHEYMPNSGFGVIEYVYQLTNQLVKKGVDVTFIQFDSGSSEVSEERIEGVTILHFPKYTLYGMCLPDSFGVWLDKLARQEQYYIFHLHSVFHLPNYTIAQYLQKRKIPYIHTPHDSYTKESMRKKKWLKSMFVNIFDKRVMDGASTVHAITPSGAASIAQYTNNPSIKLISNFVTPYPVETSTHSRKQICYIGRLDIYQKGIDLMLETFSAFVRNHPEVSFVLVGLYQPEEILAFTKLLNKHKLKSSQVNVLGKVSVHEKFRILNESYVYFQLSRFEGFGLSIVEALSMGKPVIISDKVPIANIIQSHNAGYVVSNIRQAIDSISRIFEATEIEYATMASNAFNCYQHNFYPELITDQLIGLYKTSLG